MFRKQELDESGPREGGPGMTAAATGAEARRFPRIGVELPVRVKHGLVRATVMLKDLTPYGARIEGLEKQRIGEPIMLMLPGLKPKLAFVAWSEPMTSGLEFDHPLHETVFAALVSDFAVGHHRRMAMGRPRAAATATDTGAAEAA
ncbi:MULTISPECIES: PilZ domain-containing protein [unclassified Novosphingobium]|uniref:PilZ domain-containing protein n=1 Tax=unclassified Novosphingobium TaxID=2644732 RepID=UPI0017CFD3E0|nr:MULTISPECIES: PilZ domain-containing protein [unclassified Novosphingobium]NMN06141.1 hypothetical protein [Novosphingobium sp. SG919]NMN88438.1 hypothetical protein [Novosphingobium sp. SG916]